LPPKGWTKSNKQPNSKAHKVWYVRTDAALDEVVTRHAFERSVGKTVFVEDIVRMVILAITDPDDKLFAPCKLALSKITPVPERRPGYRESIYGPNIEIDADSHLSPVAK
jgi:hypothetical protein